MAEKQKTEKYAYLDQLSTEALEELLCADIESPENDNDEAVFHILEVLEKREQTHPTGKKLDVDKAWREFQQYYNIPEGEGMSLYPTEDEEVTETVAQLRSAKVVRLRSALKVAGLVAAVVVGIFGLMVTAQAAGIDVFGAIGRWTEETFHFITAPNRTAQGSGITTTSSKDNAIYTVFQTALDNCGITEELVPLWYPMGFEVSEPKISNLDFGDNILCNFNGPDDEFFKIQVRRYNLASDLAMHTFEKDGSSMEEYISVGKTFYIMSNLDTITATWSDGYSLELNITGSISENDIKAIIDSIGG